MNDERYIDFHTNLMKAMWESYMGRDAQKYINKCDDILHEGYSIEDRQKHFDAMNAAAEEAASRLHKAMKGNKNGKGK